MTSHIALFSYGTLQLPSIQQQVFGRLIEGHDDMLHGFAIGKIPHSDPVISREIGCDHYLAIYPAQTARPLHGKVLLLTEEELHLADQYEGSLYQRIQVFLHSGDTAWVYRYIDDVPPGMRHDGKTAA